MEPRELRVLLIEHDERFAGEVREMLASSSAGLTRVDPTPSLEAALNKLSERDYQLVLLEFFLPDGAGLLNIPILKQHSPRVPLVVLGAKDEEEIAVQAVQAGAQDYLPRDQTTGRSLSRAIHYAIERNQADLDLLDAKERFRSMFDHLVEGIFQTSPEGHYLLANNALARIYGYDSPEELMRSLTDIGQRLYVQPKRREEFMRQMDENDLITDFQSQIFRKDGSMIWISENCRAVRDSHGSLLYYEGTVEDITALREAQENLRNSEALYHSLVDTMPQCIFRKDLEGRYTFVNKQFCRMTGRSLDDLIGRTIRDIYPEDQARLRTDDDHRVMSNGEVLEQVEENIFPGGDQKFIHVLKFPIFDASGQVAGIQGMFWDITKEKQMEQDLRNSETLYHSLVETMPQNVFRKDLDGRFTFANQQYCRHYNCKLEEILGKTDFDFFPRILAEKYRADDQRVIRTGRTYDIVEEHHPLGQEKTFVQVVKTPLHGPDGKVVGLQGIFWDITEQRRAEQQIRQANEDLARSRETLRIQNLRMEDDLKMASEIQLTMLPQALPVFPPSAPADQSAVRFIHRYLPSGTVGGDFFTISALSDTEAAVLICDVAGHGVRSALVTAMIRALVEELKPIACDPGAFMTKLNSELSIILRHAGTPVLTTAFYLVLDAATGRLRFSNAGHPKPIILRQSSQSVETLRPDSRSSQPALGLIEKAIYSSCEATVDTQDLVILFTDGLYEVESASSEMFTEKMLAEMAHRHRDLPRATFFDKIISDIRQYSANHQFQDDVCMVGVELARRLESAPAET